MATLTAIEPRTRQQALAEETRRYITACADHKLHLAHIRLRAIDRIKYPYTTATSTEE